LFISHDEKVKNFALRLGNNKKFFLPLQPASTGGGHLAKKASDKKDFLF
jgi:hypothetical protein